MIAKEISRKTNGSIRKLIEYIGRTTKPEQVRVNFHHCIGGFEASIRQMEGTQAMARANSDKTYHVVLSFQKEDHLTAKQRDYIEAECCKTLGFGEHQRASAFHTDTSNPHLHIAINRVHPTTLRTVTPYYSHKKLLKFSARMIQELGLKENNLTPRHELSAKAAEMEAFSSKQSLQGYIATVVKPNFNRDIKDWQTLHRELSKFSLAVKPHGNGFVIGDKQHDIWVAAKTIIDTQSLGKWQPPKSTVKIPPQSQYRPTEQTNLWDEFTRQKNATLAVRQQQYKAFADHTKGQRGVIKDKYTALRDEIKQNRLLSNKQKFKLYQQLGEQRRLDHQQVTHDYAEQRKQLTANHPLPNWQQFLIDKAVAGNENALKTLVNGKNQRGYKQLLDVLQNTPTTAAQQLLQQVGDLKAEKKQRSDKQQAIKQWIDSRNQLVGKASDVIEHQFFGKQRGTFTHRGTRQIGDSQFVSLLEKGGVMFVKPITEKQMRFLRTIPKGKKLNVSEKGFTKNRVRS